jgi:hypothetical protein
MHMAEDYDSEEARQARRDAYYDKLCWCGHALGNHTAITGDCMLCDHQKTREEIHDWQRRMARS